jgi:hypothetical protein
MSQAMLAPTAARRRPPPLPARVNDEREAGELLALDDEPTREDTDQRLRTEVWNGLVHCLVSNAALWETVDVAEVKTAMTGAFAALPRRPLALQPLWDLMIARNTPFEAAMDTALFFASRADRWGIEIKLPSEADYVSLAERKERVARLQSRGTSTGTYVGLPPSERPRARRARDDDAQRAPTPLARALMRALRIAVVLCLGLGAVALAQGAGDDDAHLVEASLSGMCAPAKLSGRAVVCWLTPEALADLPRAQWLAARSGAQHGVEVVLVDTHGEVLPSGER